MNRRKGELSPAAVDIGWPHQVAIPEDRCTGKHFDLHRAFCKGLSLCDRGHGVRHEDVSYRVFCFKEPEDDRACTVRRSVCDAWCSCDATIAKGVRIPVGRRLRRAPPKRESDEAAHALSPL
jgi:hypothetical protein